MGVSTAGIVSGDQLTVYSSLPLQGPLASRSQQIVNGEKLALAEVGGRVHRFRVSYASLDDANPATGEWDPGITSTNAKIAAQDTATIAYLGDYDSAASAISLPLMNAAGVLQISPASSYVGLTSALDAGQDEPGRFYPTGQRTFGRLVPADPVQAAAVVRLLRALGVQRLYVIDDQDPFDVPLADIVSEDAQHAGIAVRGEDGIDTTASTEFGGEVKKVSESGAQAVFFSGRPGAAATALWQQLHSAIPGLRLLGSSALDEPSFATHLEAAASAAYLMTPVLPTALDPPAARRVLQEYRREFHEAPGPYALYGYEAMSLTLLAIRRAGAHGNDRQAVIHAFYAIKARDSVLGSYSIDADGDTTLARYGVDRVVGGQLTFERAFDNS